MKMKVLIFKMEINAKKICFKQIPLESTLMEKIQLNKILMWHLETMEKLKII